MARLIFAFMALFCVTACGPRTMAPADGGVLLMYTRSGGIAGRMDTLTIHNDGSLVLTDKTGKDRHGNVPSEDLDTLRGLLKSEEFKGLAESYGDSRGADRMTHIVEVTNGKRVSTMDGADHPEVLKQVLSELTRLMGQVK
jgi:hypothetical protein